TTKIKKEMAASFDHCSFYRNYYNLSNYVWLFSTPRSV
ncbi:hypothetical protein NT04LM_4178, partial [Listeria monocytogenes FSL F2-208]